MLSLRGAQVAFLIVTLIAVGAALFRVANGPDRARERRSLAQKVCVSAGGEWAAVEKVETCSTAEALPLPKLQPHPPNQH